MDLCDCSEVSDQRKLTIDKLWSLIEIIKQSLSTLVKVIMIEIHIVCHGGDGPVREGIAKARMLIF